MQGEDPQQATLQVRLVESGQSCGHEKTQLRWAPRGLTTCSDLPGLREARIPDIFVLYFDFN